MSENLPTLTNLDKQSIRKFIKPSFAANKNIMKITIEHPTIYEDICWLCEGTGSVYTKCPTVTLLEILMPTLDNTQKRYKSTPSNKIVSDSTHVDYRVHTIDDTIRQLAKIKSTNLEGIRTKAVFWKAKNKQEEPE